MSLMDDTLRQALTRILKPAFNQVGDAARLAFPGIDVDQGFRTAHERELFACMLSITFDPSTDEHEAVGVSFVYERASMLLDYGRGAYSFADPDDEALFLEVETGRGATITMLGPAFPELLPAERHHAYVEAFAARAADHLSDSIPVILRALERSEFRPSTLRDDE